MAITTINEVQGPEHFAQDLPLGALRALVDCGVLVHVHTLIRRDGFLAPYDASITTNVEHLDHALDNAQEVYDSGLNLGQFLRAGRASQAVQEGFPLRPPLPVRA